jgi:hypothetical protein
VTAILGFNCIDGVLMLADTEETTSVDTKSECEKLRHLTLPYGQVLLGGAGDSHFIEYAMRQFCLSFLQRARTWEQIEEDLNEFATRIVNETVGQYRGFPIEATPGGIEMLVAVHSNGETRLFNWLRTVVVPIRNHTHASIGVGTIQTHPMLEDTRFSVPAKTMLLYGVHIMRQTKRIVRGCGGKTEGIALHSNGTRTHFFTEVTSQTESLIVKVNVLVNQGAWFLIGETLADDSDFNKAVAVIPIQIKELREEYRRIVG